VSLPLRTRSWWVVALLVACAVSADAAQVKFTSPGAAATEAIQRADLCRNIQRLGGSGPAASVPIDEVRAYYRRLGDGQWAALQAQQQREIEQSQAEQRITNALTTALRLQESQIRALLDSMQKDLDEVRQQVTDNSGGWVLWLHTTIVSELDAQKNDVQPPSPTWETVEGFDRLARCQAQMDERLKSWDGAAERSKRDTPNDPPIKTSFRLNPSEVLVQLKLSSGSERFATLGFQCLPGTIDPRGAK
jgi:hypothetical protein